MSTIHVSQHAGMLALGAGDPAYATGVAQTYGHPVACAIHEVDGAQKIALEPGCRVCCVSGVGGGFYAISGTAGDDDIEAGGGMRVPFGQAVPVPVGKDGSGAPHTHLLVCEENHVTEEP